MDIRPCIKQVCGEGMPEGMRGECMLFQSCLFHGHADGMLDRAVIHGFAGDLSLEKVLFEPVSLVVW